MAWTNTLSTVTPAGTDSPRGGDDRIREGKAAFVERLDVDGYWPLSTNQVSDTDAGEHRKVTLRTLDAAAIAALSATKAYLYRAAADGELYFKDDDDNTVQLTKAGRLLVDDTNILLANNTYMVATDAAGTGTVNLIKANASDKATLPDGAQLATSAAPSADAGIANKKYVDDQIDASAGGTYGGGKTITFPGGCIMKWGQANSSTDSEETFTFPAAFPTACEAVLLTRIGANAGNPLAVSEAPTAASFKINRIDAIDGVVPFIWFAVGY